jgi:hypothetical protein
MHERLLFKMIKSFADVAEDIELAHTRESISRLAHRVDALAASVSLVERAMARDAGSAA